MKKIFLSIILLILTTSFITSGSTHFTNDVGVYASTTDELTCNAMSTPIYQQDSTQTKRTLLTKWKSEADTALLKYGFDVTKGIAFKSATSAATSKLVPIHRLYNNTSTDFIWLPEGSELESAKLKYGYSDHGIEFYASLSALSCSIPVYRVQYRSTHKYTTSTQERDNYLAAGWSEGSASFYVSKASTTPPKLDQPRPILPNPTNDADGKFSFAVFSDTQSESHDPIASSRFTKRSNWILANKATKDYRFALHTGDLTNWGWLDTKQYDTSSAAMSVLENNGFPYFINIGNHDTRVVGWDGVPGSTKFGGANFSGNPLCPTMLKAEECNSEYLVRQTQDFNSRFNTSRFGSVTGQFEVGKVDNVYSTFQAGNKNFMILSLELWPRPEVVEWAKNIVSSHPTHNVIVMTHSFLDRDANNNLFIYDQHDYGNTSPKKLRDEFITKYPNIKMVFSGHRVDCGYYADTSASGNKYAYFLQNQLTAYSQYQNFIPVRDVEIDIKNNTIKSRYFDILTGKTVIDVKGISSDVTITDVQWV